MDINSAMYKTPLKKTWIRWVALFFMTFVVFGDYYCYDNPQALDTQLQDIMGLDSASFNMLYSIYALPNIILPLIGGYLTDYFGERISIMVCGSLVFIGQIFFCLGGYTQNYALMLIGRLIYALGGDCLTVAQGVITSKWFQGNLLAFALSFSVSLNGLATGLNSFFTPRFYTYSQNLGFPLLIGCIICFFGLISCAMSVLLDVINSNRESKLAKSSLISDIDNNEEEDYTQNQINQADNGESMIKTKPKRFDWKVIQSFSALFWILTIMFGFLSLDFYGFTNNINDYYSKRYSLTNDQAGLWITTVYIITTIFTPIFGYIVDKYARRITWLIFSGLLAIFTFSFLFSYGSCSNCYCGLIALITFGLFWAGFNASIMPCLPLVLGEEAYGTGFGLYFVCQNITLFIFPLIGGAIIDATESLDYGYYWFTVYMLIVSILSTTTGFICKYFDTKNNNILEASKAELVQLQVIEFH